MHQRWAISMVSIVLVAALGACRQDAAGPYLPADGNAPIQTDQQAYHVELQGGRGTFRLKTTYTNRSDAPRYLVKCGPAETIAPISTLEKLVAGVWKEVYRLGPCPPIDPLPTQMVALGESATHDVALSGVLSFDEEDIPRFEVSELPGVYRLTFAISLHPDDSGAELVALEQRVSNAFELRAP